MFRKNDALSRSEKHLKLNNFFSSFTKVFFDRPDFALPDLPAHIPVFRDYALFKIFLTTFLCVFILFLPSKDAAAENFIYFAYFVFLFFNFWKVHIRKVYLSHDEVSVSFFEKLSAKTETFQTKDCVLFLNRNQYRKHSTNYSYLVSLVPKKYLPHPAIENKASDLQTEWLFIKSRRKNRRYIRRYMTLQRSALIPISPRIFTAKNLKLYVEHIQKEIPSLLNIYYTDEQVKRDYQMQKYKAMQGDVSSIYSRT